MNDTDIQDRALGAGSLADVLASSDPVLRDPLARAMIAAWVGVEPDKLPAVMNAHTCVATMTAWKRVGDAAMAHLVDKIAEPGFSTMDKVSRAISDPGLFAERKRGDDWVEDLSHWQARAAMMALGSPSILAEIERVNV